MDRLRDAPSVDALGEFLGVEIITPPLPQAGYHYEPQGQPGQAQDQPQGQDPEPPPPETPQTEQYGHAEKPQNPPQESEETVIADLIMQPTQNMLDLAMKAANLGESSLQEILLNLQPEQYQSSNPSASTVHPQSIGYFTEAFSHQNQKKATLTNKQQSQTEPETLKEPAIQSQKQSPAITRDPQQSQKAASKLSLQSKNIEDILGSCSSTDDSNKDDSTSEKCQTSEKEKEKEKSIKYKSIFSISSEDETQTQKVKKRQKPYHEDESSQGKSKQDENPPLEKRDLPFFDLSQRVLCFVRLFWLGVFILFSSV